MWLYVAGGQSKCFTVESLKVFTLDLLVFALHPASLFGSLLNTSVHIVVYSYYGLAAIGPHMQQYLWWKKDLTSL